MVVVCVCVCVDGSTSQCVSCCSNSWTPFLVVHPLSLSHRCCCCCCCSSVFFCPCCCCCPVEAEICLESREYLVMHLDEISELCFKFLAAVVVWTTTHCLVRTHICSTSSGNIFCFSDEIRILQLDEQLPSSCSKV